MQHFVYTKIKPRRARLSLGIIGETPEAWQQKARTLRLRRARLLKLRLHAAH